MWSQLGASSGHGTALAPAAAAGRSLWCRAHLYCLSGHGVKTLPAASGIPPGECCLLLEVDAMCLGTIQPIYRWVSRSQAAKHQTEQLPSWHSSVQLCSSVELNPFPWFTHVEGVLHTGGCSARRAPCTGAICRGKLTRQAEPSLAVKVLRSQQRTLNLEKNNKPLVVMERAQRKMRSYPNKAGWKPAFAVQNPPPPPLLVGGIHHFDDVSGLESQLLVIHGDVVPERLCVHHAAITDELWAQHSLSVPA